MLGVLLVFESHARKEKYLLLVDGWSEKHVRCMSEYVVFVRGSPTVARVSIRGQRWTLNKRTI